MADRLLRGITRVCAAIFRPPSAPDDSASLDAIQSHTTHTEANILPQQFTQDPILHALNEKSPPIHNGQPDTTASNVPDTLCGSSYREPRTSVVTQTRKRRHSTPDGTDTSIRRIEQPDSDNLIAVEETPSKKAKTIATCSSTSKAVFSPPEHPAHDLELRVAIMQPDSKAFESGGQYLYSKYIHNLFNPSKWIHAEVIMAFLTLVAWQVNDDAGCRCAPASFDPGWRVPSSLPRVVVLEESILSSGKRLGPRLRKRWSISDPPFGFDAVEIILVPLHEFGHWSFGVIRMREKTISVFNSAELSNYRTKKTMRAILDTLLSRDYDTREWIDVEGQSKLQNNHDDCGVFVMTTGELILRGLDPLSCDPDAMPDKRRDIALMLYQHRVGA